MAELEEKKVDEQVEVLEEKQPKKATKKKTKKVVEESVEPVTVEKEQVEVLEEKKPKKTTKKKIKEVVEENIEPVTVEEEKLEVIEEKSNLGFSKDDRFLDSDINFGLSDEIVNQRIAGGLVNKTKDEKGKTVFGIICSNVFTFFNMVFAILTILLVFVQSYSNLMFLATVIPNLIIGIVQEIKAKKMIEKLSLMSAPVTTVIRNGEKRNIPINEVVLDDVILLKNGKQVCADCVVIDGMVEANESMITGEADAISKKPGDTLFSGSFITSGTCYARADKIGGESYIEKLAGEAKKYRKPNSELLKSLNIIFKIVSFLIVPLGILTFLNIFGSDNFFGRITDSNEFNLLAEAVTKTAGSMIGMIPAGLFLLTSMALFVGVYRLGKNNTLVQELYCIETLASVDTLCLDTTGTITDGTMRVWDCIEVNNQTDYTIREIVGSMMNAFTETNATSEALINYFDKNNILTPVDVIPFSSKRKFSAVTFKDQGTFLLGAPEFVLTTKFETIRKRIEKYTSQGCRVLVVGHTNSKLKLNDTPRAVSPVAIIVIQDHIREEAADTIKYFKRNGVDIRVISGDNPLTVSYIARRVGIEGAEKYVSLDGMTDDEVRDIAMDYTVFGRVSPTQKKILVETFRENKKTVAMTGDGVNDILALKEADCAIAMASGSEATRYVSHLVLMDSNFANMPKVVNEGRRVINNIQKTSTLFLVKTMFAITLTIMYLILKEDYIFVPKNLSMIEWFAIGVPAFFIALQPNTSQVKGKFIVNVIKSTLPGALTVVIFHLALHFLKEPLIYAYALPDNGMAEFKTLAILVTSMISMLVLYKVCKPFNLVRGIAFGISVIGCVAMLTIPFAKQYLGISDLSVTNLLLLLLFLLVANGLMNVFEFILKKLRISK